MTSATIAFQVQPEFHAVPLGTGEDSFDERMRQFAHGYWGERADLEPLRLFTKAAYTAGAQTLAENGVVYNALGVFPIGGSADGTEPPERVSRATLTVGTRELDNPDPQFTAMGIAQALDRANDGGETRSVSLPAGPAVVHVAASRAVWELPEGEQEHHFVRIEVWLPFPSEDRVLLLCLSTPDVQDLFRYQAILADIADTVVFGLPEDHAQESAATASPPPSPFRAY
ncbi:hypothetical protein PV682_20310 [Streptomyces niveiscabiei]|uniref:hypothetical protein n=1 Tax=Streptomyces niveiscabiei TaxID=164115 RepID=UPI0029B6C0C3|nr:hypothetical protein [Streptomyces niveiscabiei]MDX3383787.1 hypothetical protein [Streptomyces niveiscabiei]